METIKISDNISPVFYNYWRKFDSSIYNVTVGGRRGFKSTTNALKIAKKLIEFPNTDAIVFREHFKDHKRTTYRQLIEAFAMLGVKLKPGINYPKGNDIYIQLWNGSRVEFFGDVSTNFENLKGIKSSPSNKTRLLWFFEISQIRDEMPINQLVASYLTEASDENFQMVFEWNPPQNKNHWIWEWEQKIRERDNLNYLFVNYVDHPQELLEKWLGKLFLQEMENLKEIDEDTYNHVYLGQSVTSSGRIYKKFEREHHTVKSVDTSQYQNMLSAGVDTGFSDKWAVEVLMISKKYDEIYVAEELVFDHQGRKELNSLEGVKKGVSVDPETAVIKTIDFLQKVRDKYSRNIIVKVDGKQSKMMFDSYLMKHNVKGIIIVDLNKHKKLDESETAIEERINFGIIAINSNRLKVNEKCKDLIIAFEEAHRGKNGNRKDDNSTTWNDSLDAFEYAFLDWIKTAQNVMIRQGVSK